MNLLPMQRMSIRSKIRQVACYLAVAIVWIAQASVECRAEITERHRAVVQEVFDRLMAVAEKPEGWDVWPPKLEILDSAEVNAKAGPEQTAEGIIPKIWVNVGLVEKMANFDPELLAFVMGHELGHLALYHSKEMVERFEKYGPVTISTAMQAANRDQELEADLYGMQLVLKAGYSHRSVRRSLNAMRDSVPEYCSFEGLVATHPSWDMRAIFIQQEDVQRSLWQSMVAFSNGVLFLEGENYIYAEECFRKVTEEFPDCYEGWANLGYAQLMQYADMLDEDDLRNFDLGHIVVGGFYRRPESMIGATRGIDERLWFDAVGHLREAIRLAERLGADDPMIMVKANLAVAYLIHPAGKQVGEAEKYFADVLEALSVPENAAKVDPLVRATILINSSAGRPLDQERIAKVLEEIKLAKANNPGNASDLERLSGTLAYSQALQLASLPQSDKKNSALERFETYLSTISTASAFWPIAYSQYEGLAKKLNKRAKAISDFKTPGIRDWRVVSNITLPNGETVGLAQMLEDIKSKLGEPVSVQVVIPGTNVKRYTYSGGISILASRDVIAIYLTSPEAPKAQLKRIGLAGAETSLSIGMSRSDLEQLLGDEWEVDFASIDDPDKVYQLYRDVGIGVQFKEGKVSELVLVMVPRKVQ